MRKLRLALTVCLSLYVVFTNAQLYETRSYDLPAYKSHAVLSETEQKKPSVILLEKRFFEYAYKNDNELVKYYTCHRHIRINEPAAIERYNKIYLPVSSPGDLLSIKVRSVTKSGKIHEMFKGDMKKITEDGTDYQIMAVEGLEQGSELEYFYTIKLDPGFFQTDYMQSAIYTRLAQIQLITPENLIFEFKAYNGKVISTDTITNKKRFITLRSDSVPELDPEEKYAFFDANKLRIESKLARNTGGKAGRLFTWADAGNRYYEILHQEEKSAAKEVQKLASTLGLKKLNIPDEQIRSLEKYMKSRISIKMDEENPTIGNMIKKNYGGKNQIASLYVLMLEHLGISHEFVITSPRSEAMLDPDFDTWNYLDEYLIYIPASGKFIAPTNYLYRYGQTPHELAGNFGLHIKKYTLGDVSSAISSVKKIEMSDYKENYDNIKAEITFENNLKEATIKFVRDFAGHSDNSIRAFYFYSDEDSREQIVTDLLTSSFKDIKSKSARMLNYDLEKDLSGKPLQLEGTVTTTSLIESAGDNVVFSVGMVIGEQVEMYQDHVRQNPISMDYPHNYHRVIEIIVPDGYTVKGLDKLNMNIVFDDKGIGFTSKYELTGNKLTVTIDEFYKQTELPVSAYEDFKKVINAAADFNKIKLIFTKSN